MFTTAPVAFNVGIAVIPNPQANLADGNRPHERLVAHVPFVP
jgi:hypothetical protein